MTKKDYVLIAAAMRSTIPMINIDSHTNAWHQACVALAVTLKADNSKFDRARFLAACGVQS